MPAEDPVQHRRSGAASSPVGLGATVVACLVVGGMAFATYVAFAAQPVVDPCDSRDPYASGRHSDGVIAPGPSVLIRRKGIAVEQRVVAALPTGTTVPAETRRAVRAALSARRDVILEICRRGGAPFTHELMVIADEDLPFGIVSPLLDDAREEHFEDIRLVVRRRGPASPGR